ncbi:hypothetical protein KP003_07495 [Geomonas nitrogeniifigens]|uniref:Uncharacterized protein n=1 Tax=Geomonas diazotrophica TaxID=2843197 RepID=A0ABX8JN65_9BACT|nr:DUF5908 family protein [Geomonas nitrogeniifigens]QWV99830.1 hypothetical protein KP005_07245 [Geomonas nitrogeniifigens]QXE88967.1 hypothetical protein KP003_07495 [Geomonas nitrogeniifigens]
MTGTYMPIEIKELHIKIALTSSPAPPVRTGEGAAREAIVSECVEQVLQVLKNKAER